MRRIYFGIFSAFLALGLSSCGDLNYSVSSTKSSLPEELFYQTEGRCENGDLVFNYLVGAGTMLWTDPAHILVAQSELFLSREGTFSLRYREFQDVEGIKVFDKELSGRYFSKSDDGVFYFENLGQGKVTSKNGLYYLDFQYTSQINSANLLGKKVQFRTISALQGKSTDRTQACGY